MMSEESEKLHKEYLALCHAMQTGVAMMMNYDTKSTSPKHLRTGVNSALVESSVVMKLLISKGLITQEECMQALVDGMKAEVARYEKTLEETLGRLVNLK